MTAREFSIEHAYNKALAAMRMLGGEGPLRVRLLWAWLAELSHLYPDTLSSPELRSDFEFLKSRICSALELGDDGRLRLAETFTDSEVKLGCDAVWRVCTACVTAHDLMLKARAQDTQDSSGFWVRAAVTSALAEMDRERLAAWAPSPEAPAN